MLMNYRQDVSPSVPSGLLGVEMVDGGEEGMSTFMKTTAELKITLLLSVAVAPVNVVVLLTQIVVDVAIMVATITAVTAVFLAKM